MALGDTIQSGSASVVGGVAAIPALGDGNTLVVWIGQRVQSQVATLDGGTEITGILDAPADGHQSFRASAWYISDTTGGTTSLTLTVTGDSNEIRLQYVELEGVLELVDWDTESVGFMGVDGTATAGTLTLADAAFLVGGLVTRHNVSTLVTHAPVSPSTELADASQNSRVPMWLGRRDDATVADTYDMEAVDSRIAAGGPNHGHMGFLAAFAEEATDPPPDPEPEPEPTAVPGMWADWGKDGFAASGPDDAPLARMMPEGELDTDIDEITDDVIHVVIRRGGFADHLGGTSPGTMTVTVKNHTGKYNPDNASSPYHPHLVPDVPIWFGVNEDGTTADNDDTVYGRFGGYIREIVPLPVPGSSGTAQLICDDAMARYRRARPRVTFDEGRSIAEYRAAILDAIGETRYDLDTEADVLPFSGTTGTRTRQVITGSRGTFGTVAEAIAQLAARQRQPPSDALRLLEELNSLVGTRHFVEPGDSKEEFYNYRTVNRHHGLADAAVANLDGDDVTGTNGYRVTSETIVNLQEVEVRPTSVSSSPSTVWRLGDVPFALVNSAPRVIVAEFGDDVFGATLDVASNGSTVTTSFTSFGDGALIRLDSAGTSQVTSITVTGTMVRRDPAMTVEKSSSSSVLAYGEHRGASIGSDLMQSSGLAQGIADFIIWKFAQPLKRPSVSVVNTLATTLPLELYDVVTLSIDRLNVSGRRFEMIGLSEEWNRTAAGLVHAAFSFELQETPNQTALSLFTFDQSAFNGSDGLAP